MPLLSTQIPQIVQGASRFELLISREERRRLHALGRTSPPQPFARKPILSGQNRWLESRLTPSGDGHISPRITSCGSRQELRVPRSLQNLLPMREHVSASGFSSQPFDGNL